MNSYKNFMRDGPSKVLNVDLSHNQWFQATLTLPVNKGGIDIRSVVFIWLLICFYIFSCIHLQPTEPYSVEQRSTAVLSGEITVSR